MLAELGMVFTDPGYRLADRTGHTGPGPLGRRRGSPLTATQAKRVRELPDEEVALGVGLRGPLGVPDGASLLDVVVDLGEASAVGVLGSRVDHLARVAERRAREIVRLPAIDRGSAARLGGDEIQHVVLPSGVGEKPREVSHALEIADVDGVPVEDYHQ
jgi:hypothetical protein